MKIRVLGHWYIISDVATVLSPLLLSLIDDLILNLLPSVLVNVTDGNHSVSNYDLASSCCFCAENSSSVSNPFSFNAPSLVSSSATENG